MGRAEGRCRSYRRKRNIPGERRRPVRCAADAHGGRYGRCVTGARSDGSTEHVARAQRRGSPDGGVRQGGWRVRRCCRSAVPASVAVGLVLLDRTARFPRTMREAKLRGDGYGRCADCQHPPKKGIYRLAAPRRGHRRPCVQGGCPAHRRRPRRKWRAYGAWTATVFL